jgi:hypothetical protein
LDRELEAIVAGLRSVLGGRPGIYAPVAVAQLDNETLAAQNANPQYGELLARWGRQTGYTAIFELTTNDGSPGLLRASVIVSRYAAASGAQQAYAYVLENQGEGAQRLTVAPRGGGRAAWDEAVVFYRESTNNGHLFGQYTLIFRLRGLIGFVTNVGLAEAVSARDTEELTVAVFERLRAIS